MALDIHVFSDAYGRIGEQITRCALSQFNLKDYPLTKHPYIVKEDDLKESLSNITPNENMIFVCSIIDASMLDKIKSYCEENNITIIDVLTSLVDVFEEKLQRPPVREKGVYRKMDENYFKRIEAIEFTVKYDDGKNIKGLEKADLILVGISRTSKTPLSIYLANTYRLKVVNIPIIPEVKIPDIIYKLPRKKIIGLTNSIEFLNKIRIDRVKTIGSKKELSYSSYERIIDELEYAENIMKKLGCPIINVSDRAIEETAQMIINITN